MYSPLYSTLVQYLPSEDCILLENYFLKLSPSASQCITLSKAATAMSISKAKAGQLLNLCCDLHILRLEFSIRCPECGMLIQRITSLAEINSDTICYNCSTEFDITNENLEAIFCINENPYFQLGQPDVDQTLPNQVAQSDSLAELLSSGFNFNSTLFNPSDSQYDAWEAMYDDLTAPKDTTKAIGDSLEKLFLSLLNAINGFTASSVKTTTNQIDCYVRCRCSSILPFLGERFVVECKNENTIPGNSYFHKLTGIIDGINGGGNTQVVKLGIIVAKKSPASTIRHLAVIRYARDGLVLITFDFDDLAEIIKNKKNLLEMIERKRDEIILDSTSKLSDVGIFNA